MKRRWLLLIVVLLIVGLVAGAWFEPEGRLRGLARGEAFHAGRPTSYWADQLSSIDPKVRHEAIWELREGDPSAEAVLAAILENPANPMDVRIEAAVLLGHIGARARPAVPALVDALGQPDPYLNAVAVRSLGQVAPDDDDAIAKLVPLLAGSLRLNTLTVLARVSAGGLPVVQALQKVVEENSDPAHTTLAIEALGIRKQQARPAVEPVSKALAHTDPIVRKSAAETLGRISPPDQAVIAALSARLSDGDAGVRECAARSLGWFGRDAKSTVPSLRKLLDDSDPSVRNRAAQALRRIDPPAGE